MIGVASYLDAVPLSGIIRIRDMMYRSIGLSGSIRATSASTRRRTVKAALAKGIQTTVRTTSRRREFPPCLQLIAEKLRTKNGDARREAPTR